MVAIVISPSEEVLESGQRVVTQVDSGHPRYDAYCEQPAWIAVAAQEVTPTGRDPHHYSQPEGQDQPVEGASEDQQLDRSGLGNHEDQGRDNDEGAHYPALPAGDPGTKNLQEGRGRVGRPDDGGHRSRPHDDAEHDLTGGPECMLERRT